MENYISESTVQSFYQYLIREEKSTATVEKYLRDARAFLAYIGKKAITKEVVLSYKKHLQDKSYAIRSINSMLASINSLLNYLGAHDCKVKFIKLQKQTYCAKDSELTKAEYFRLLESARAKARFIWLCKQYAELGFAFLSFGFSQ